MREEPTNASLLEELHRDEAELHTDEKRIRLLMVILIGFIVLFTGVTFYFARTIGSIERHDTQSQIANSVQPSVSRAPTISQPTPTITTAPSPNSPKSIKKSEAKVSYINTGFGTNQSSEWSDVFGAATTADIAQYDNIKEVRFEAFINVPTANGAVSVRLYNKTDNHPVWNSEVTKEGKAETIQFISPIVNYDLGPKLYQVQMKSQLNVVANLVQSRVSITTK